MRQPDAESMDLVLADLRRSGAQPQVGDESFAAHLRRWLDGEWALFPGGIDTARDWHRLLKPGGYSIALVEDTLADLACVALRRAGFEVRDTLALIGAEATDLAILARKPFEGPISKHVLRWGVGPIHVDAVRVGTGTGEEQPEKKPNFKNQVYGRGLGGAAWVNSDGRWPPNILLRHEERCQRAGFLSVKSPGGGRSTAPRSDGIKETGYRQRVPTVHADSHGRELVERWSCVEDCVVRRLDEQSGNIKCTRIEAPSEATRGGSSYTGTFQTNRGTRGYSDEGGASRFFPQGHDADLVGWLVRLVLPSDGCVFVVPEGGERWTELADIVLERGGLPWEPGFGDVGVGAFDPAHAEVTVMSESGETARNTGEAGVGPSGVYLEFTDSGLRLLCDQVLRSPNEEDK